MCDGHLLLPYYSEITSGADPILILHSGVKVFLSERLIEITSGADPILILHSWNEGLFIREAVPGST